MNIAYSLYCDETGMFSARDTHVICPLIVRENALRSERVEGFWKKALKGSNWRNFHALDAPKRSLERMANLFWTVMADLHLTANNHLGNFLRDHPEWLLPVIKEVLANRKDLPGDHPIEQVIPYLAMLAPARQRRDLIRCLNNVSFPQNIIETIKRVMMAQLAFGGHGTVSERTILGIEESIETGIKPQWSRYRLGEALSEYTTRKPNRWHIGPMEVLPFNCA